MISGGGMLWRVVAMGIQWSRGWVWRGFFSPKACLPKLLLLNDWGNELLSSGFKCCIQLSSNAAISWASNLALMDGTLTFHKIRDTRCFGDNKIQIGLFQRATQSWFCSWVTWQIVCWCEEGTCVLPILSSEPMPQLYQIRKELRRNRSFNCWPLTLFKVFSLSHYHTDST